MEKKNLMTREGLDKLETELQELKLVRRKEVAEKIKEAREQGDLSENAEYDAAKDEQRDIEARIEELTNILKNAEVIDIDAEASGKVNLGTIVTLLDLDEDEEVVYEIVGSTEANSLKGRISNESPLGRALIGAEVNEVVSFEAPVGVLEYKVLKVEKKDI